MAGEFPSRAHQFKPGQSGNPKGRPSAGAAIREWVNVLAADNLNTAQIREIANDARAPSTKRAAALRILGSLESGDLADFAPLIRGEVSMEDLRANGINTAVIKRFKQRTRQTEAGTETTVEIELHDRSGIDFDRVVEHTDGKATQRTESVQHTHITVDSARSQINAMLTRHLGTPIGN